MKSLDNQILKLLSNNDVTFFIPPYQRNYEWEEEQCKILFNDILKTSNENNTQHFFGTLIYYSESSILGQPDKYILVDGQQRLTTVMLFLMAFRDSIKDQEIKNYIDSKYLKNNNVTGDVEYKIKLKQVETDWKSYKAIILNEDFTDDIKKSNVYKNYIYFKNKLEKIEQVELNKLLEKGLNNFPIVTIQLQPEINDWEKPQEIFESMNSLGKPLSLADLVRNYLLLGKPSDKQEELYHKYWIKIEKNLSGENASFSVSSFIRDYMQLVDASSYKQATETNYKQLYRDFKELFQDQDHENLIKDLALYSDEYSVLAGYKSSGDLKIDQKIKDINTVKAAAFYSIILGLLHLKTENKIINSDILEILDSIFIYITRRRLLNLSKADNKGIPLLVKQFEQIMLSENKKNKMFEILSNQQYTLRIPNDNDIKSILLSTESNFYNLKVGRFIQILIEEYFTKNRPDISDKNLQVEHIMPIDLTQWKNELGDNYNEIYNNYINNIGNLTLIRHNPELSNKPFKDKKIIYEHKAGMQIAKEMITNQDKWGEEQITNRAIFLVDIIVKYIIPLPEDFKSNNNYSLTKKVDELDEYEDEEE